MRAVRLLAIVLLLAPAAHANLFGDVYLFSDRPQPVAPALAGVLYHFYQDASREALIESLYIEKRLGEQMPERDQILLARAGSALALGLVEPARQWLSAIDAATLPADAAPRFDLALARLAFLDGDDARASVHIARLPAPMQASPAVQFLVLEIARRRDDIAAMAAVAGELPEGHRLWYFAQHNLGVAAYRSGNTALALTTLDRLAQAPAHDATELDLTLRADLQAAALTMQQGALAEAVQRLEAMPGTGPYGRAALAAHARVLLAQSEYGTAAQVYGLLAADAGGWDAHRLAGTIGAPFALESGAGHEAALLGYRSAVDVLAARAAALDGLASRLAQDVDIAERLAELPFLDGDSLRAQLLDMDAAFGGVDWVTWLASARTQQQLAGFRRLRALGKRIDGIQGQALALAQAAEEQERRLARAAYRLDADGVAAALDTAAAAISGLAARLEELQVPPVESTARRQHQLALATAAERDQLTQLGALRARAEAAGRDDLAARVRRLEGRFVYDIEANAAERRWQIEKQRRADMVQLAALRDRAERIRDAELERRAQSGAAAQVASYQQTLTTLHARVRVLAAERSNSLLASLTEQVQSDRAETASHLAYARLAVARINDALMMARARASR